LVIGMQAVKIAVIVQSTHEQTVREALARAGAGKIGDYRDCQFITHGKAQFKPTAEADPAVGEKREVNEVDAVRIETWCESDRVDEVVRIVKEAHPNEEPAIEVTRFELQ
jgi:hypothetical protein